MLLESATTLCTVCHTAALVPNGAIGRLAPVEKERWHALVLESDQCMVFAELQSRSASLVIASALTLRKRVGGP
jgi:hypothetical protein